MNLRILHVLDHSAPLHSGYTFRTLAILREQRALGWDTLQLTTPKQGPGAATQETVDGLNFLRTPSRSRRGPADPDAVDRAAAGAGRGRQPARPDPCPLAGAQRLAQPVGGRGGPACRWCTRCVRPGRTRPWTTAPPAKAACATGCRASLEILCPAAGRPGDDDLRRAARRHRRTRHPGAAHHRDSECGRRRGLPLRRPSPTPQLRRELGLEGATVLGFAGSFYGYEGLDLLIEAAARMLPGHPDAAGAAGRRRPAGSRSSRRRRPRRDCRIV